MTIKFNNFEEKKQAFANAIATGSEEEQATALTNMLDSLAGDVKNDLMAEMNTNIADNAIIQSRGSNVLTSAETKFFNAVIEEGGFKDSDTLPKTTQDRIFEDLTEAHPLLDALGIQNFGAVTEFIYSDPSGMAVWGPLFGDIKGQLNATFRKESISQLKLTAFIPLANDMLKLGPVWIERYVRTIIVEAISVGLEKGFVAGTGKDQPIGLLKDLDAAVTLGVYADKASAGTLTFTPGKTTVQELKGVVEKLSTKMTGPGKDVPKIRNIAGKVVMVVNPFDNFSIQANATIQNATGAYVTSLPFNPQIVESAFVPKGKVLFFVKGEYIAAIAGGYELKKYTETMAMEDATLFIAKQYATGKPVDNYAAQVYTLDLNPVVVPGV